MLNGALPASSAEPATAPAANWRRLILRVMVIPPSVLIGGVRSAVCGCRIASGAILSDRLPWRSEEHTSELQSLMRISYAVFCLKKKKNKYTAHITLLHDT